MQLPILQFGGIVPKIKDPRLVPEGKSQTSVNCRFDRGGVEPLHTDLLVSTPTNAGTLISLFKYLFGGVFFAWSTDVKAVTAPLANDSLHRVYYCEGGKLKSTSSALYADGGTDYPEKWLYPSPPAPVNALVASTVSIPDFVKMYSIQTEIDVPGSHVLEMVGVYAGVDSLPRSVKIGFIGTGITALDNKSFTVSRALSGVAFDRESFFLPDATSLDSGVITSITKANPGVVTQTLHGRITGDKIKITATGMTEINEQLLTVTYIDANTFSVGINTTAYTTFTGGTWRQTMRQSANFYATVAISTGGGDAISKASPCKVTHTGHGLAMNQVLEFTSMVGMTQLANVIAQITVIDSNNFTLNGVDSTAFGTFTSGVYQKIPAFYAVDDPTLQETVYYVETLVNTYGSEGPPSPVSNLLDIYDGSKVTLTSSNVTASADYGIVSKNIYRANRDASGNTILQFLANIALATTSYVDTTLAAALGELMNSAEWDAPPDGAEGLTVLANETLAAFVGNMVLFCEPGFFHAWPASYQKVTDTPVMGFGVAGSSTLVLTQGVPYLITGNHPSNYVMDKMGAGYGCVSKRSIVQIGDTAVYASTDGLAEMGTGSISILTKDIISPEEWRSTYTPTSITGFLWEQKYIGFYTTGATQAGFYFDFKTANFEPLDFYATGGYHDETTGFLYLLINNKIYLFAGGTTYRTMSITGRRYRFLSSVIKAVRILAPVYPATIEITYYDTDSLGNVTAVVETITATSANPERHSNVGLQEECEVKVKNGVTAVYLASTLEELKV